MWRQDEHVPTRLDFALGDDAAEAKKLGEAVAGGPIEFASQP